MAVKFLDNTGLGYFWSKIKAWCNATFAAIAHTHTSYAVKHSYTTAANQAKAWLRIANANTHQMDTSKPLHVQFLLTAWNSDQPADYYEQWFIDCQVFGRNSGIRIFGASGAPFSQARVLYENTVADIDTNDRPAIDIYLNYALATACHVEIQEVYNSGWTFLADGVLAASTIPTGFENRAVGSQGSGVHQATYANYGTYTTLQRSNITANITLADNDTYRMRVLNCTNAITVTVPSLNSAYAWFLIKNFNAVSTNKNVTIHPSTTSVLIDDSNADIILKPGEWIIIASKAANSYSLIGDSRWKSQKADKATTLAGYGITDAKIANGTITLGSNSITPLTSVPSHNQASNTINAMTGYSKPNFTSAIAASDTLNQAIGKLEKAIDDADISNVVHLTGDESITGIKSFHNSYYYRDNSTWKISSIHIVSEDIEKGTNPADGRYFASLIFLDKNAVDYNFTSRLGCVECCAGSNINGEIYIKAYKTVPDDLDEAVTLGVGYDASNIAHAWAPSTSSDRDSGTDIVTRNWIPKDTRIVHTTGNETIAGNKVFTNDLIRKGPSFTKGTTPSNSKYYLYCNLIDSANVTTTGLYYVYYADKTAISSILLYNPFTNDTSNWEHIGIGCDTNQVYFGFAPSTSTSRTNGTDILTRNWIPKDTRIVHTTGDETINGVKTFSSSVYLTRINPYLVFEETDMDRTTNSAGYHGISFNDKNSKEVGAVLYVAEVVSGQSKPNRQVELKLFGHGSTDVQKQISFMQDGNNVWSFQPRGGTSDIRLGNAGNRWKQLYATTTSIDTSDERLKSYIKPISNDILDAWEDIEWYMFKMNDAISEKGVDKARIHSGLIAQRLASIFEEHGLNGFSYSFLCYDKWDTKPASYDKEGKLIIPEEPAGDEYSIRYVEALCIEAAYQRRKNKILENRISELEKQVSDMLILLQNLTNGNG